MKTICASTILITAATAFAASAADVEQGETLARQWCANCHLVGDAQAAGADTAPTFASIAETAAGRTDDLKAWLADPHPPMPNLSLTVREIDDLLTYIESLNEK